MDDCVDSVNGNFSHIVTSETLWLEVMLELQVIKSSSSRGIQISYRTLWLKTFLLLWQVKLFGIKVMCYRLTDFVLPWCVTSTVLQILEPYECIISHWNVIEIFECYCIFSRVWQDFSCLISHFKVSSFNRKLFEKNDIKSWIFAYIFLLSKHYIHEDISKRDIMNIPDRSI